MNTKIFSTAISGVLLLMAGIAWAAPTISLSPGTLPNGKAGVAYSQKMSAKGGKAPYSFAVVSRGKVLPEGIAFSDGVLSGTPSKDGSFEFKVQATDANGISGSKMYTLKIAAPVITLSPASLPNGKASAPYGQTISAIGGMAQYSFKVKSGKLPEGFDLTPGGSFSFSLYQMGMTPAPHPKGGTYTFEIQATDANGYTGSKTYTLKLVEPVITLSPVSLPGGKVGSAYSQNLSATGSNEPYNFTVVSGALPPGLSIITGTWSGLPTPGTTTPPLPGMGNTGTYFPGNPGTTFTPGDAIAGTPKKDGSFMFVIQANDANGYTGSRNYTLKLTAPVLTLLPTTMYDGTVGADYVQNANGFVFECTGGTPTYHYKVVSGALPPGMKLSEYGGVKGPPTKEGSYTFGIQATDANGSTGSKTYTLKIVAP